MTLFHFDVVEAAAEPDHHTGHAAVAHDGVGAGADRDRRTIGRQIAQEIRKIVFVLRQEENLRRAADAKPGQLGERLVGEQPSAQVRHARFQFARDIGETHSAFNSSGSACAHCVIEPAPRQMT
jgi:hypothetical protein